MELDKSTKRIAKRARKGFQGYPVVTIAYYGPSDKLATKVAIGFVEEENSDPQMQCFSTDSDIREDATIQSAIIKLIERSAAKTVSLVDGIVGCPHEAGVDYPAGQECPQCGFWQGKEHFTGKPFK
mgnify:FL=1